LLVDSVESIRYWIEYDSITEKTIGIATKYDRRKTRWVHYRKQWL